MVEVITTPDTDIVVLAVYYLSKMRHVSEVWIETGRVTKTADQRRFIPVHSISKSLGSLFCLVLPAIHALTGCDSTSALFGIGRKSVLKMIQAMGIGEFADLSELYGNDEKGALRAGRKLIASLYDPKHKAGKKKQHFQNYPRQTLTLNNIIAEHLGKPKCVHMPISLCQTFPLQWVMDGR